MKNNTINKLVRDQKSILAQLEWEKRIAQDKMSDPKTLSKLAKNIKIKKEEIETLEDISDYAKDIGSYNQGYKFNLHKFMTLPGLSNEKLNIIRRLKMKLDQEESDQETLDQASSSSGTTEINENKTGENYSDSKNKSDLDIVSDSSNIDDIF